jgi:endonuclease YncB( thermonuclease family)
LAKRNDIAPYERPQARKWTRIGDYVAGAEARVGGIGWPNPGTRPAREPELGTASRRSARGLWLPVAAVALAVLLSVWASDMFSGSPQQSSSTRTSTSSGLIFGLCSEGGLTNCVASGDSFYLGGKTVRIAGIEAPQLYGAACPREVELGRKSAATLLGLLNSGELEMSRTPQDLDRLGLLLRHVAVDGKDVASAMVRARLAREIGDSTTAWC